MKILITESGGPAGVGVIQTAKFSNHDIEIISCDSSFDNPSRILSDYFEIVPLSNNKNYIKKIIDIVIKHKPDFLIPTGENDLLHICRNKTLIENKGCRVLISGFDAIKCCQNKFMFYNRLKSNFNLPLTMKSKAIVKPNRGSGSKNLNFIDRNDCIIQEYIDGIEYTVDVFCDLKSNIINHFIRERKRIRGGISTDGSFVKNESISVQVAKLVKKLKLKGPINIQYIVRDNEIYLLECNPRLAGTSSICSLMGFNFLDLYIDILNDSDISNYKNYTFNKKFTRYFENLVYEDLR